MISGEAYKLIQLTRHTNCWTAIEQFEAYIRIPKDIISLEMFKRAVDNVFAKFINCQEDTIEVRCTKDLSQPLQMKYANVMYKLVRPIIL